ncbi:MAG: polyphosphate kinase 1 [Bacteroidales bacterium]|nr:polyphosphate kinase 1 [Bacteroidales bacterium]MCF8387129.1 polyphosphate kinase 1 [Bacteroidales bacterium]MCF8398876.1 polyphosphate kinase 1 [Bacteroidales bacterium]
MAKDSDKFINRELSWLHFNERVLQEAMDVSNPLIERLKFMGIYSNNRDEFFRVRVATIKRMLKLSKTQENLNTEKYETILADIQNLIRQQEAKFTNTFEVLKDELSRNNIHIIDETELSDDQEKFVYDYYIEHVRPHLFPLMLDNIKNIGIIQDASIYLAVELMNTSDDEKEDYALIKLPTDNVPRFLILPNKGKEMYIIFMDDVIRFSLGDMFSVYGYDSFKAYTIKFTRDSELDIDNDVSKSFVELMSESVKQRKRGEPVRFVFDKEIPERLLKKLSKKFNISKHDTLREGGRYHNFKDFMGFPKIGPRNLRYPPSPPLKHPELDNDRSFFDILKEKDIMLHYPYQSFQHLIDFLREASIDPKVRSIKMTFYRAAKDSQAMNALINAARNGKYVTVFMEIQARFDEEANIYWTERLQEEGIKVMQTIPGYKVHSKMILIRRRENGLNHFYANISTGNFNESTAKVYADDSLLTANNQICADLYKIFDLLESKIIPPRFSQLIVAPYEIRSFFIRMLENEITAAKEGKEAWAIIKLNSLVDKKVARKLYEASQAGVKIKLINRGICVILPGVRGLSENIEAFSIVDKFLEHSRVYIFNNNGDHQYYISSADWMQRNFDHRIEVVCPIYDQSIRKELMDMIRIQLKDNTKSRWLSPDRLNQYRKTGSKTKHRAQFEIYDYFKKN